MKSTRHRNLVQGAFMRMASTVLFGAAVFFSAGALPAKPAKMQKQIMVDQFGYRPGDRKTAVIADPQIGFNARDRFIPGAVYEVRRWNDDTVVYSDSLVQWNGGAVDFTSGDRGWWFDFTPVREEGDYYVYDRKRKAASHGFRIAQNAYRDVLKAALRVFYYQRLNEPKIKPWAEEPWTDAPAFMGPGQDGEARAVDDKGNAASAKDLSGGWMDAGDYNKYVTFAENPVHQLLTAYERNPSAFTDDTGIPESGNGIPDVLDEVKFELDWLKKMQQEDGGLLIKIGNLDWNSASPPSSDRRPRFYGPECSSSSIAGAGMFAHAALVFENFPALAAWAAGCGERAARAWDWFRTHPRSESCDTQEIKSGDADRSLDMQDEMEVVSAVYLFALTGGPNYHDAVKTKYALTAPFYDTCLFLHCIQQGDALLFYTTLPGADAAVKNAVLSQRRMQSNGLDVYRNDPRNDLYMAYLPSEAYTWGSNNARAALGGANMDFPAFGLDGGNRERFEDRALGILHYFHGVNPLGIVYLTNMYGCGAETCADAIWHDWFGSETGWKKNPPPGYVPGGPNFWYNGSRKDIPAQPPQKCYLNWNKGYPENSWEIVEPAIYYQASYVRLISNFVHDK
jgi:endoglucanase